MWVLYIQLFLINGRKYSIYCQLVILFYSKNASRGLFLQIYIHKQKPKIHVFVCNTKSNLKIEIYIFNHKIPV